MRRYPHAARLLEKMNESAIAKTLGMTVRELREGDAEATARDLLTYFGGFCHSSLSGALGHLAKLAKHLGLGETPELVPQRVGAAGMRRTIAAIAAAAKEKALRKANGQGMGQKRSLGAPLMGRKNDGSSAAENAKAKFAFLTIRCGYELETEAPIFKGIAGASARTHARSEPLSIALVAGFEMIAVGKKATGVGRSPNEFERGFAAQLCTLALSSSRFEQAQCSVLGEVTDEVAYGCVSRAKSVTSSGQMGYPLVTPAISITGEPVFSVMRASLHGVESGGFLLRDNNSLDGSPERATAWKQARMSGARWLVAFRSMLRSFFGLSEEEAKAFGATSARAFMAELAAALDKPPHLRANLGPWSGSALRDADLRGGCLGLADMPNRYGAQSTLIKVGRFKRDLVLAARSVYEAHRGQLPLTGGWELLMS